MSNPLNGPPNWENLAKNKKPGGVSAKITKINGKYIRQVYVGGALVDIQIWDAPSEPPKEFRA